MMAKVARVVALTGTADAAIPLVYVVDSDRSVSEALRLFLNQHGCQAEAFASAAAVLERMANAHPKLVIIDSELSDMDSIGLLQQVRARDSGIAVIILGRQGDVSGSVNAIRNGAIDFLEKPFLQSALLRHVRKLFPDAVS